jgi:hypothetical protein
MSHGRCHCCLLPYICRGQSAPSLSDISICMKLKLLMCKL